MWKPSCYDVDPLSQIRYACSCSPRPFRNLSRWGSIDGLRVLRTMDTLPTMTCRRLFPAYASSQTANPPEACCLGSPAATKLPLISRVRPWAVDWPGATQVTLWPSDFMKATVALSYAYSKLTLFG